MPVMKNIGRNATTIARVASTTGGSTSFIAREAASTGENFRMPRYRLMFSTPTIGSSTSRPRARMRANRVTRLIV